MKLLVLGDFHGTFPARLKNIVREEKIDLVVSNGDYCPFHYRNLWFKHCYGTDVELWEVIGKKRYQQLVLKDLAAGERALRALNALPVPVVTVLGNVDHIISDSQDVPKSRGKRYWAWEWQDFMTLLLRKYPNIHRVDYRSFQFGEYVFLGAYGGTNPGKPESKAFRLHVKKLDRLFAIFSRERRAGKVLFVSHNVPYNTRLDKIAKNAHVAVRGKHYGSKLVRRAILQYHPRVHIGGHIHEGRGKDMLGKTLCVNPGSVHEGQYAIVEIPEEEKGKVKVRFS